MGVDKNANFNELPRKERDKECSLILMVVSLDSELNRNLVKLYWTFRRIDTRAILRAAND